MPAIRLRIFSEPCPDEMGWVATGVTLSTAMVVAIIVHHLFSGIRRPETANVALVVLAIIATLVIGWVIYLVTTTRTLVTLVRRELAVAPTSAPESDSDTRNVLSFSIVPKGNSMPDSSKHYGAGMCMCQGSSTASARPGMFKRTVWLTPVESSGSTALTNAILSGRVKYVIIGGAVAGAAYSQEARAMLLYDLSSFEAPENCTAVTPTPAIPGTKISQDSWRILVELVTNSRTPLHVLAF